MSETWTQVRFLLYPFMLAFGLAWVLLHVRMYHRGRCAPCAWSVWLGAAVAVNGAAGLASLVIARVVGFGPLSSAVFTVGPAVLVLVTGAGVVALFRSAWRG